MRIPIDKKIMAAMQKQIIRLGSRSEFARRAGVEPSQINKYVNGVYTLMGKPTWQKIYPLIKDDLLDDNGCYAAFCEAFAPAINNGTVNGHNGAVVNVQKTKFSSLREMVLNSDIDNTAKVQFLQMIQKVEDE